MLASLTERYWPAVYGYLRGSGVRREELAEVTQAFFEDVVLSRGLFEYAEPALGRLRSLVMASLKRYMVDRRRRSAARWLPDSAARLRGKRRGARGRRKTGHR